MATNTQQTLDAGADRIFHCMVQLFGYYSWFSKLAPVVPHQTPAASGHLHFAIAQNAVIDGHLINLRRLNEFFTNRPQKGDGYEDDLRAYHFGFPEIGRFLHPEDMTALHKGIAHSTNLTASDGFSVEVFKACELGLKHSFAFLDFLVTEFYKHDSSKRDRFLKGSRQLQGLWASWQLDVQLSQKAVHE